MHARRRQPLDTVLFVTVALSGAALAITPRDANAQAACPAGMTVVPGSPGVCCWPGQGYAPSVNRCVGAPNCAPGFVGQGERCVADSTPTVGVAIQAAPPPAVVTPVAAPPPSYPPVYGATPMYPPTYTYVTPRPQPQRRRGLIVGGAVLFGVGYISAVIAGTVIIGTCNGCSDASYVGAYSLYIPIAGPWITLAAAAVDGHWPAFGIVGTLLSGVTEVGGFAMMLAGARRRAPTTAEAEHARRRLAWAVYPTGGRDSVGVGFSLIGP
jgi:hypothetical protein